MTRRTKIISGVVLLLLLCLIWLFKGPSRPAVGLEFLGFTNDISQLPAGPFYLRYEVTNAPFTFAMLRLVNHSDKAVGFTPMAVRVPGGEEWIEWSVGHPGNRSYKGWLEPMQKNTDSFSVLKGTETITFPLMTPTATNAWCFTVLLPMTHSSWKARCYSLAAQLGIDCQLPSARIISITAPSMTVTESVTDY